MNTQAELREKAERLLRWVAGEPVDRAEMEASSGEIAADYLRLTDPTPLTAEHCRAAGMTATQEGMDERYSENGVHAWSHYKSNEMSVDISEPTVGLLYAARRNHALPEISD